MAVDYGACVIKLYPTAIPEEDFSLAEDENGVRITLWNEAKLGAMPTLQMLALQDLAVYKTTAILHVKKIRQLGLDKVALSAGVLAVYNENYTAAQKVLSNEGSYTLKCGYTAIDYMTGFGARLNMTAAQFADYIIAENERVGPTAYDVERRYLALAYGGDAALGIYPISALQSKDAIDTALTAYANYCGFTLENTQTANSAEMLASLINS